MKKTFLFSAIAVLAVSACTVEALPEQEQGEKVYREFTAVISDGAATKVTFGEGNTDTGKVSATWAVDDEVLISDGTTSEVVKVISVSGNSAKFAGYTTADFNPKAAYYPASMYDAAGTLTFGSTQKYSATAVPAPMTATVTGTNTDGEAIFTFSAADGYSVVRYSLTGDIAIKEAYLYARSSASMWAGDNYLATRTYTLKFDTPLSLTAEAQDIYFVVSSGTSVLTLEAVADAPATAYTSGIAEAVTADYSYYRRKTTAVELTSGKVYDMPAIDFTSSSINAGRQIWEFGTDLSAEGDGIYNWYASDGGSITASTDYITVTMGYNSGTTKYRADLRQKSAFDVNLGTYRFAAVKFTAPAMNAGTAGLPSGASVSTAGTVKFDVVGLGNWRGNNAVNKTCTVTSNTENCQIWVYDMLTSFYASSTKTSVYSSTGNFTIGADSSFKIADLILSGVYTGAPTYDVYWFGFFNSIEEVQAYVAADERLSELPTTSIRGRKVQ